MDRAVSISGSASLVASAPVGVDASVLLATIKTHVSASATMTLSASEAGSLSVGMTVRPGKIGYLQGGILRLYDTGRASWRYDDCGTGSKVINVATPYLIGVVCSGG